MAVDLICRSDRCVVNEARRTRFRNRTFDTAENGNQRLRTQAITPSDSGAATIWKGPVDAGAFAWNCVAPSITRLMLVVFLNNISKKWTMPIRDWKAALNRFTIQFEERLVPG
ncbi:hypothetical protein [Paraburkholderia sp. 31.1]|uniref:hypothetical protein n=1 Tax=Paraburkholderia sp. 31.1 TaxID=2615205 RepID=UPI0016554C1F|nr:hypothetical protein [Paraburkholderia sp. 31.1]